MTRHSKHKLPRTWMGHPGMSGLVLEADLRVSKHSRLRCKLLVFSSLKAMRSCYSKISKDSAWDAHGLFHPFYIKDDTRSTIEVDPRYWGVIMLAKTRLCCDYLAHEICHAAHEFARRTKRKWPMSDTVPEEKVCYPMGRLMDQAMTVLRHEKLL